MISYLAKNGDTATIRCVFGEQSKVNAALYGGDRMLLDSILNDVNSDDNIKHVCLAASFYDDEDIINEKIKSDIMLSKNKNNEENKENNSSNNEEEKDNIIPNESKNKSHDWKCPECGIDDCLVDKHGNKYPCLGCLQIDIGQKIMQKLGKDFTSIGKEINKTMNVNNQIITGFMKYLQQNSSKEEE
jgi:predicted RNA-binding Zn-ribbon protein involved in translation (DUF1610 family)